MLSVAAGLLTMQQVQLISVDRCMRKLTQSEAPLWTGERHD